MDRDQLKRLVGERAANDYVRSGMRVGLGTGSTAIHAVRRVGALVASGELTRLLGVPTSFETVLEAQRLGIALRDLNDPALAGGLDLVIDGADEVDPQGRLIKGGGGALTIEKIVAYASARLVVVVDEVKLVPYLGKTFPVPLEVIPAARITVTNACRELGGRAEVRMAVRKAGPVISDNGNLILDVHFDAPFDPAELEIRFNTIPGVVENGIFSRVRPAVIVARADGSIETIEPAGAP